MFDLHCIARNEMQKEFLSSCHLNAIHALHIQNAKKYHIRNYNYFEGCHILM